VVPQARPEAGAPEAADGDLLPSRVHGDGHGTEEAAAGAMEEADRGGGPAHRLGRQRTSGAGGGLCVRMR
jgi:hypothetical protein